MHSLAVLHTEWPPADALQVICDLYKEETGVDVTVVQEDWKTFSDRFFSEMDAGNPGRLDMVVGDSQWLGTSVEKGLYVDLTKFMEENQLKETLVQETIQYYSEYPEGSGKLWSYPTEGDAIGWAYRKDLFDNPEEMAAFSARFGGRVLAPPTTLDELKDIAEFFTRPDKDLYGVGLYTESGYDEITMGFETALFSYGGDWKTITNDVDLGSLSSSADALQYYKDLHDCCTDKNTTDKGYDKIHNLIIKGKAAMIMSYFAMMGPLASSESNPYANSTGKYS